MNETLFKNAYEALTFALNFSSQQYGKSPMIKISGTVLPSGKGLGGLDGAGQAGIIRAELKKLGELHESILIARFAPHSLPAEKGNYPHLDGEKLNVEWVDAIRTLERIVAEKIFQKTFTTWDMRVQYIQRYFLGKKTNSLAEIADANNVHETTVRRQYNAVKRFFAGYVRRNRNVIGEEENALRRIDELLTDVGIVNHYD